MCDTQIRWITLGSEGWKDEVGPTYGATDKPIENIMPPMGTVLTADQIAAVAAFERTQYGGLDAAEALTGCGFTTETVPPAP
jgi:mono/diheme cytochrome c family protein